MPYDSPVGKRKQSGWGSRVWKRVKRTVVLHDPESVELGNSVRGTGVEGGGLGLGGLVDLSIELGSGGLVQGKTGLGENSGFGSRQSD